MEGDLPIVKPFPIPPNPADFEHLPEFERMVKGLPYRPFQEDLVKLKTNARVLLDTFNKAAADDNSTRKAVLEQLLPLYKEKRNVYIKPTFRCSFGFNIKFGHNFFVNNDCYLYDTAPIEFGNDCKLGPSVHIYTPTHPVDAGYRLQDDEKNYYEMALSIKIGDNCWIGGGSILCPGVRLGNNVVVGAGAVVTKPFGDNVVIAGNPAKVIRYMPEPTVPSGAIWRDRE